MPKIRTIICKNCGKKISTRNSSYCNNKCRQEYEKGLLADDIKELRYKRDVTVYRDKLKKLLKEKVLEEKVIQAICSRIESFPPVSVNYPVSTIAETDITIEEMIVLMSDFHIGEVVSAQETMGIERYDIEIFKKRLQYYIDTIIDIRKNKLSGYRIDNLHCFALGDMVCGMIHKELEVTGDGNIIDWVLGGAYIFSQALMELAQEFSQIKIYCVVGNHGRLSQEKYYKNRTVNWDRVFYEATASYCKQQPNIDFIIPQSWFYVANVLGHTFLLLHGDDLRCYNAKLPFYSIEMMRGRLNELLVSNSTPFENLVLGHFHNISQLDSISGGLFVNGSFIGGTEYSIGKLGRGNHPKQLMMGVNRNKGVTFRYNIDLKWGDLIPESRYKYDNNRSVSEQI